MKYTKVAICTVSFNFMQVVFIRLTFILTLRLIELRLPKYKNKSNCYITALQQALGNKFIRMYLQFNIQNRFSTQSELVFYWKRYIHGIIELLQTNNR